MNGMLSWPKTGKLSFLSLCLYYYSLLAQPMMLLTLSTLFHRNTVFPYYLIRCLLSGRLMVVTPRRM